MYQTSLVLKRFPANVIDPVDAFFGLFIDSGSGIAVKVKALELQDVLRCRIKKQPIKNFPKDPLIFFELFVFEHFGAFRVPVLGVVIGVFARSGTKLLVGSSIVKIALAPRVLAKIFWGRLNSLRIGMGFVISMVKKI
jgi:hypothetical protein